MTLRHLRAVRLAVLIKRLLLTGRTAQPFIHFIIVVPYGWAGAAHGRVLVILGDASQSQPHIRWDNGAAVHRPQKVGRLHPLRQLRERRVVVSFWLQGHRADTDFDCIIIRLTMQWLVIWSRGIPQFGELKP